MVRPTPDHRRQPPGRRTIAPERAERRRVTRGAELGDKHLRLRNARADQLIARRCPTIEKPVALARRGETRHRRIALRRRRTRLKPALQPIESEARALEALQHVFANLVAAPAD